jgi:hypothetical protein
MKKPLKSDHYFGISSHYKMGVQEFALQVSSF